jgi:hypothetical protein
MCDFRDVPADPADIRQQRAAEAAHAVWDWRAPPVTGAEALERGHPRRHQAIQGLVRASLVAVCLGMAGLLLAAIAPVRWLLAIRKALDAFGHAVGVVVSTVVLSLVYFGFMLPAGLLSRRRKDSRYRGAIDRSAASYWTAARPSESAERQF